MNQLRFCPGLLLIVNTLIAQPVDRVEPPSWWAGMVHQDVQLMVHGDQVSDLQPVLKYPGVKITGVSRAESPNYLFVDLRISKSAKPGLIQIIFSRGRTEVQKIIWKLDERVPGSAQREGVDQSDVIYLITPDRFANGDPGNDQVTGMLEGVDRSQKGARHGGDIEGIREHLDYISGMGFTAIWCMPLLENDMARASYHGYSTTDYYRVDPRFGSNEDWKHLVEAGKAFGLKHIMDMIPNHCGLNHWWMEDLPFQDWINQSDSYQQTNHRKSAVSDPYASAADRKLFTDGWFVRSMPDLNQRNAFLARYLTQNAIWWVEYLGLQGIRIDTYPYSNASFLAQYCRQILEEYPDLFIVGEQWHTMVPLVAYWQKGHQNADGYVSWLPQLMDFPIWLALVSALNAPPDAGDPWLPVYETLSLDFCYASPADLMIFADNHDMSRIFTQVGESQAAYRNAMMFLATMRGIPQIFYGTEIQMANPGTDDHTVIRSDFPGGWFTDMSNGFTGEGLTHAQQDAQEFVRHLLQWRRQNPVVHDGGLMSFSPEKNVYVYFRYDGTKRVMVILNKNTHPYRLSLERFQEMLKGARQARNVMTGKMQLLGESILLEEAGPYLLEITN